jgi:hypothetical protein
MAHRKFGQRKEETAETVEPITFDLADVEGITCRPKVNGKLLIELVGKVDSGNVTQQSEGILQVFEVCVMTDDGDDPDHWTGRPANRMKPAEIQAVNEHNDDLDDDDYPIEFGVDPTSSMGKLQEVLDDPNTEIDIEELAELVGWMVEQYTGRPTVKPGNSRGGPASTRLTSRRARRSQDRATAKQTRKSSSGSSTEPLSNSA